MKVETDLLNWLQDWYTSQCDGDWEHQNGVKIDTLDNPGWKLEIDVFETEWADKPFEAIEIERSESDWVQCALIDTKFDAAGGSRNLKEMIQIFRTWIETDS